MPRGFTFIEVLISLLVMSVLLATAAPAFERLYQSHQAKRLASEFQGFFVQARSETVMRNQNLWIHYAEQGDSLNGWVLALRGSESAVTYANAAHNAIMVSRGEGELLSVGWNKIELDRVNGKPAGAGNITFAVQGAPEKQLKMIFHNVTGRLRICGGHYGYDAC
ncbi:pilus assembly protein FimT [Vibrio albus]|uniref:Type II secretion system protein H n=1 Tax=Vibrio albus TaxID=2200953 RepID=A0A2U3BCL4_9VIBR|nr:GspH/FimT family pseudopilin [Vibrio albus]PWI34513.1 pilus assembly protein FimT [Vibrio albus]